MEFRPTAPSSWEWLKTQHSVWMRLFEPPSRPPACAPVSCSALGRNCGTISDGCGTTLNCGACSGSLTCGGGGTANVCGPLTPTTSCSLQGKNCGAIRDGAGGWLACGTCASPQVCGGSGTPNVCGTPAPVPSSLTFNPNAVD